MNNAGAGLTKGESADALIGVNFHGAKNVTDFFVDLMDEGSKVVNVGSSMGPHFVQGIH